MKYAPIIFLQDSEALEVLEVLKNKGLEAAMDCLSSFDYGEYSEINDKSSAGTNDKTFEAKGYFLSYNIGLEYIGLEKIIL